jgi:choline-sulfatase
MPVGDTEIAYVRALYDGGVAATDAEVGKFLALLDELGIADTTLVAVTADHGEELGDRTPDRLGTHGTALYDSLLHVPLILRDPTRPFAGRRIAAQVRLIDVMPTLLDRLGVAVPPETTGRTLLPFLDGTDREDRLVYAELLDPASPTPRVSRVALRDGRYKLIVNVPPLGPNESATELYDVAADPSELDNLAVREPAQKAALATALREEREAIERQGFARFEHDALQEDAQARLRALGYVE